MSEPTCITPMLWSIGQACAALCARAEVSGREERTKFNWVMLVAERGVDPEVLAARYWVAVTAGLECVTAPTPLCGFDVATAAAADRAAAMMRSALAGQPW